MKNYQTAPLPGVGYTKICTELHLPETAPVSDVLNAIRILQASSQSARPTPRRLKTTPIESLPADICEDGRHPFDDTSKEIA